MASQSSKKRAKICVDFKPSIAPNNWVKVGEVSKVTIYPVKSCKGIDLNEATATPLGFQGSKFSRDRTFLVGTPKGHFRTQRRLPKLTLIEPSIHENELTLNAPNVPPITIKIPTNDSHKIQSIKLFDETVKVTLDCGDDAGEWLTSFLEEELRLFYHVGEETQRKLTAADKKFPHFGPADKGSFQDVTSFMFISQKSLEEVNRHLKSPLTMTSCRPNLVIKGTEIPFEEDLWTLLRIGDEQGPLFKVSQPCIRCNVTTLDPNTGIFRNDGEPLKTLKGLQRSYGNEMVNRLVKNTSILGVHMGLFKPGQPVSVGDPVYKATSSAGEVKSPME